MLTAHSLRNYLFLLFSLLLILFLLVKPWSVYAQTDEPEAITSENYNSLIHSSYTLSSLINGLGCLAEGQSILGGKCPFFVSKSGSDGAAVPYLFEQAPGAGAIGASQAAMLTMMVTPPVKTAEYIASVGRDLGLVKEAHAQVGGSGAGVISPIFNLWQAARNIAYLLMTVIFLISGFMIMFRRKLNPQTVVTIQLALPGLVVGLIMITFSYFLASLIVDLAFLGSQLVGQFFAFAGVSNGNNARQILDNENVFTIFSQFIGAQNIQDTSNEVANIFNNLQGLAGQITGFVSAAVGCFLGRTFAESIPFIGSAAGCVFGGAAGVGQGANVIGMLLYAALIIGLIFSMFKLLLSLITRYVMIIFLTITAPFQFTLASLPGNGGMFNRWVRNMLCNVLAFPAVFAAFYLAAYFVGPNASFFNINGQGADFSNVPQTLPLFGNLGVNLVRVGIAYGILMATPGIPNALCELIATPTNPRLGGTIGGPVGTSTRQGWGVAQSGLGGIGRIMGRI